MRLQRTEHIKQLRRKQIGTATIHTTISPVLSQTHHSEQPVAAVCRHQRPSCAASPTACDGAVVMGRDMPCQLAEHAGRNQRAPLQIIAQAQWQLQSMRPASHKFVQERALHLCSARAASLAAVHTELIPDRPSRAQGMGRVKARKEDGDGLKPNATLPAKVTAKRGSVLPRLQKAIGQPRSQKQSAATKQLEQSSTPKRGRKCTLKRHAGRAQATVQPDLASKMTGQCSVSLSLLRGSPLLLHCHNRRSAVSIACAVSSDARRSAPPSSVASVVNHQPAPLQASRLTGRRAPAPCAVQVEAKHPEPLAQVGSCRQQVFSPVIPDNRARSDTNGTADAAQCADRTASPAAACGYGQQSVAKPQTKSIGLLCYLSVWP